MSDELKILIGIRCDAGRDRAGHPRKSTLLVNRKGNIQGALVGWPSWDEFPGIQMGPIIQVTYTEYEKHLNIATGVGL